MPNYRRAWHPGGTYFFTVNLFERSGNDLLVRHIDHLRDAVRHARINHPFTIHAWVVLPDHLHCVIELPPGDTDFATRWRLIIVVFPNPFPTLTLSAMRLRRGERAIRFTAMMEKTGAICRQTGGITNPRGCAARD